MSQPSGVVRPEPMCGMDTWMPVATRIVDVRQENFNTHTFRMEFVDAEIRRRYRFVPGQFNMVYVPGVGEAAISMSSHPERTETLEHTIRIVGSVTRAADQLGPGKLVGLRGPFGKGWPLEALQGKDVVLVAGGIGIAPLRPVVYSCWTTATGAAGWCSSTAAAPPRTASSPRNSKSGTATAPSKCSSPWTMPPGIGSGPWAWSRGCCNG